MSRIKIPHPNGKEMGAYISIPKGNGPFPALIVLQEAFGVNNHMRHVADGFAKENYFVIAPELFHRTADNFECSYTDFASAAPHLQALTPGGLTEDLHAVYDWLQKQDNVKKDKIGSIGFCLGGRVSFLANAVLPLSAAVSYYGGGMQNFVQHAAELHAPQLFFWGGLDKHIPAEQISVVTKALDVAQKKYINAVISYADHGFNCDERASYNAAAAREARAMTLAFLENNLK